MLSEKVNLDMWVLYYSEVQYERTTETLQQPCTKRRELVQLLAAVPSTNTSTSRTRYTPTHHTIGAAKCHEADGARLGQ